MMISSLRAMRSMTSPAAAASGKARVQAARTRQKRRDRGKARELLMKVAIVEHRAAACKLRAGKPEHCPRGRRHGPTQAGAGGTSRPGSGPARVEVHDACRDTRPLLRPLP